MTRILIFSPYALWTYHTTYEGTIAKACQAHGATVEYLLCDGLLPECDQHWDSKTNLPRPFDASAARTRQRPAWITLSFLIAGWEPL